MRRFKSRAYLILLALGCTARPPAPLPLVDVAQSTAALNQATDSPAWTARPGSSNTDQINGVALDSSGNAVVAGLTTGTLDGQPSAGGQDAFLTKYSRTGTRLWTRQFGTSLEDAAGGVAIGTDDSVYVSGFVRGNVDGQVSIGQQDVVVRKYDAAGTSVWTRLLGTLSGDFGTSIAVGGGGLYVAGYTGAYLPNSVRGGKLEALVAKYDEAGNRLWQTSFGSGEDDKALGIAVDGAGKACVTGVAGAAMPGATHLGGTDIFVACYGPTGTRLWMKQFGTPWNDSGNGISVGPDGTLYVAATAGTAVGKSDAWLLRIDAGGALLSTQTLSTPNVDEAWGVASDLSGVYLTGRTLGQLPGANAAGDSDLFLAKYDASGGLQTVRQFSGGWLASNAASGLGVDVADGRVLVGGFIPWGAFENLPSRGAADGVVLDLCTADGFVCAQSGDCSASNGGCTSSQQCTVSTAGTVTCGCGQGFTGVTVCTDLNECRNSNGGCDVQATCANTAGSRTCTCPSGFSTTNGGVTCEFDPCLTNNGGCASNATCTSVSPAMTVCTCPSGYTTNDGGATCLDVDDCGPLSGVCRLDQTCQNVPGSFVCGCPPGQMDNGTACVPTGPAWSARPGTSVADQINGVALDSANNVVVAGQTKGALDGQLSAGGQDAFVTKYAASGSRLWTQQFGAALEDAATGVAIGSSDSVYVAGFVRGAVDGQASLGQQDVVLRKFDASGSPVWTRLTGTATGDFGTSVAFGGGGVYVAGYTAASLPGSVRGGKLDALLAKYDEDGNRLWQTSFGSSQDDKASGVAVDSAGNVYVVGTAGAAMPGSTVVGRTDIFVACYSPAGTRLWLTQLGSPLDDTGNGITITPDGTIYVAATVASPLPIGFGSGTGAGVYRLDSHGAVLSNQILLANTLSEGWGIASDLNGTYLTGRVLGQLGLANAAGDSDLFVAKFDGAGLVHSVRQFSGGWTASNAAAGLSVAAGGGRVVIGGYIPWGAFEGLRSLGGNDGVVLDLCNTDGFVCPQSGNCLVANGGCTATQQCTTVVADPAVLPGVLPPLILPGSGTVTCGCGQGFTGVTVCTDLNECRLNNGGCGDSSIAACVNTSGSYTCDCSTGYTSFNGVCVDACDVNRGGCDTLNGTCSHEPGSFAVACGCPLGYLLNPISNHCYQDHCSPGLCANGGTCHTTEESFTCDCPAPWGGATCDTCQAQEVNGDLVITNGAELAQVCLTTCPLVLNGSITIQNSELTSLDGLGCLSAINGVLTIQNNPSLTSLSGLSNVTKVGGIQITGNPTLTNVDALNGVQQLDYLTLSGNAALASIPAFPSLTTLNTLTLSDNTGMQDIGGFSALQSATFIDVAGGAALRDISGFGALTTVVDGLRIQYNSSLEAISGFPVLTDIQRLWIWGNPRLQQWRATAFRDRIEPAAHQVDNNGPCPSAPCANGGSCVEGDPAASYTCHCIAGFTGLTCTDIADAGAPDTGVDAGPPDEPDAGVDAGPLDAGRPDAGPLDAGRPDAGPLDAGRPDAGPPPNAGPCWGKGNGDACDDGNPCTTNDSCQSDVCAGTATSCDDGSNCTTDTCNPTTGACEHATCASDSNPCTTESCNVTTDSCVSQPIYMCSPPQRYDNMGKAVSELSAPWGQAAIVANKLRLNGSTLNTKGMTLFAEKVSVREGFTATFTFESSSTDTTFDSGYDGISFFLEGKKAYDSRTTTSLPQTFGYGSYGINGGLSIQMASQPSNDRFIRVLAGSEIIKETSLPGYWATSGKHTVKVVYVPGFFSVLLDGEEVITDAARTLTAGGPYMTTDGFAWIGFAGETQKKHEVHEVSSFTFAATCPSGSCGGASCSASTCNPTGGCGTTPVNGGDDDNDFICNDADPCPSSYTNDADNNGNCDNNQICAALADLSFGSPTPGQILSVLPNVPSALLDGISFQTTWSRNGAVTEYSDVEIPADVTHVGEIWSASVNAFQRGEPLCSGQAQVTIASTVPSCNHATATLQGGQVVCTCDSTTDTDGDVSAYACSFRNQAGLLLGTSVSGGAPSCSMTAPVGTGTRVDCSIAPVDLSAPGVAATASVLPAANAKPSAPADMVVTVTSVKSRPLDQVITCQDAHYANTTPTGDPEHVLSAWHFAWTYRGTPIFEVDEPAGAITTTTLRALLDYSEQQGTDLGVPARGDDIQCTLSVSDGLSTSNVKATGHGTVSSSPPMINSIAGTTVVQPYGEFECTADVENSDGDDTTVKFIVNTNGAEFDPVIFAQQTLTLSGDEDRRHLSLKIPHALGPDQRMGCFVSATDPDGKVTAFSQRRTQEGRPVLSNLHLAYADGTICSPLTCNADISDVAASGESDTLEVWAYWFLDGEYAGQSPLTNIGVLPAAGTTVSVAAPLLMLEGHRASCYMGAHNITRNTWGYADDYSPSVSLIGVGPTVASATTSAGTFPRAGDTVTCVPGPTNDNTCPGATLSYLYQWKVNGTSVAGSGATFSTVGLAAGDQVTCSVAANIGTSSQSTSYVDSTATLLHVGTWVINGSESNSFFGVSTAVVDDSDGDGLGELLVGSPMSSPGGVKHAGKAYLMPARPTGGTNTTDDYDQGILPGTIWTGESGSWDTTTAYCSYWTGGCNPLTPRELNDPRTGPVGDALGGQVLAPGDTDGDGVPDIVISAPYARGGGGFREGRVYMVSGAHTQAGSIAPYAQGLAPGWAADGEVGILSSDVQAGITTRYGDIFGWNLAHGDFNGDGLEDLVVGAPEYGGGWSTETYGTVSYVQQGGGIGRGYVVSGSQTRSGVLWMYDVAQGDATGAVPINGMQFSSTTVSNYGSGSAWTGDLNNDGRDDLLFGTLGLAFPWYLQGTALDSGASLIASPTVVQIAASFSSGPLAFVSNTGPIDWVTSGKYMWQSLPSGVGDVNGDGKNDVAMVWFEPSFMQVAVFTDSTSLNTAHIDDPRNGFAGFSIIGKPAEGWISGGSQVSNVGDVDGDGLDDVAFTVTPRITDRFGAILPTRIYVAYGKKDGSTVSLQQIESGEAGFTIDMSTRFWWGTISGGDLDGDGLSDIVFGEPTVNGNAGRVSVYFGRDRRGILTQYGTGAGETLSGTSNADALVGGAGDDVLVGRGGADVLIGGAGNDVLEVQDATFGRVRGGRGFDTLRVDVGDLNLTEKRGLIQDVEAIELTASAQTLTVTETDVLKLSSTSNDLYVSSYSGAQLVTNGGDWSRLDSVVWNGHTYKGFQAGNARLFVQDNISTTIPPRFTTGAFYLAENAPNGTSIGRITADDADGVIASLSFSGGVGDAFDFDPVTGNLTVKDSTQLNYEVNATWTLQLTATDNSGLTTTGTIVVNLIDVPEAPVIAAPYPVTTTDDGADDDTVLLTVAARDDDEGDTLTWSITDGNADGAFKIDALTGVLSVADGTLLNYQTSPTRQLVVRVMDSTHRIDETTVTINVEDVTGYQKTISATFSASKQNLWLSAPTFDMVNGDKTYPLDSSFNQAIPSNQVLQGSLNWQTTGSIHSTATINLDTGSYDFNLPMDVTLAFPSDVTAGVPFYLTTTAQLRDTASLSGSTPSASARIGLAIKNASLTMGRSFSSPMFGTGVLGDTIHIGTVNTADHPVKLKLGGTTFTSTRLGDAYPNGVSIGPNGSQDYSLLGLAHSMKGVDGESTDVFIDNPNVFYSQRRVTEIYNGAYDWATWLENLNIVWGGLDRGAVPIDLGGATAILSWILFPDIVSSSATHLDTGAAAPSSMYIWAGMQQSYALEWRGARVQLTFEDGSTKTYDVSYQTGSATTAITIPAGADRNGDGKVSIAATVRPLVRFYNWTKPYFRYDQYWYFMAAKLVVQQSAVNQYTLSSYKRTMYSQEFGPALSFGVSASYNFDEFLEKATNVETAYSSYATARVVVDSPSFNERTQYDINTLTPVTVRAAVRMAP